MAVIKGKTYKVIISDYDGTLTGKEIVASTRIKEAVMKWEMNGMKFIIASGRSFNGPVESLCRQAKLTAPQITRGGSEIVDPVSRTVIYSQTIRDEDIAKLVRLLDARNVSYWMEKGEYVYTPDGMRDEAFGNVSFRNLSELDPVNVPKFGIFRIADPQKAAQIEDLLKKEFHTLHVTRSFSPVGHVWDITAGMANKHTAVIETAKLLDIAPSEIIGIGDGYNDFPLLQACGYKVAMENANEELKAVADEVIPSYTDHGVAVFIDRVLRNRSISRSGSVHDTI